MFEGIAPGSFCYSFYDQLLKEFTQCGYSSLSLIDNHRYSRQSKVFLRHDVDFYPQGVLKMAEIEKENNFNSTWCFLVTSSIYNPIAKEMIDLMTKLHDMGHWCCIHVDAAMYNNFEELCEDIARQYEFYAKYLPLIKALSFHRPLPNMLDDIKIPGFVGAYEKQFFTDIYYVSDSNRRTFWQENRLNEALQSKTSVQLLTHPIWWNTMEMDELGARERLKNTVCLTAEDTLVDNCKFFKKLREGERQNGKE